MGSRSVFFVGRAVLALAASQSAGCGEETMAPPPPRPRATGSVPVQPPKPTAKPPQSASGAVSAGPSAAPVASFQPTLTGPLKWADFAGPEVTPELKPGDSAWAVLPVSAGWETLKFTVLPVSRVEGAFAIFQVSAGAGGAQVTEVFVPGAFTTPVKPPDKLSPDDAVLVSTSGSRAFGRVLSPPTGGKVKIRYRYAGTLEEKEVDLTDVIELDGTVRFGAPVGIKEQKDEGAKLKISWRPGQFVHASEDKAWIVTTAGKPMRVPLANVKPLGVNALHKAGDKVWAARGDDLVPGQVTEVEDGGTRYKIKLDESGELTASLEAVTAPLK